MQDEIIDVKEVVPSPRGKRLEFDADLLELLKRLPKNKAARLSQTYGEVPVDERQRVVHAIKRHWEKVRDDKPSINFSPEGVPQVSVRLASKN